MKKLLIIGSARHGKDTVAEFLNELFGYKFESSSVAAARIFLYDKLKEKYGYASFEECFEDRVNHRAEWHDEIAEFNREDKARLAKEILKNTDIYVGMRSNAEIDACLEQGLFDLVIGVYNPRVEVESADSNSIDMWAKADIVIPNAEGLGELKSRVAHLKPLLFDEFENQSFERLDVNTREGRYLYV